MRLYNQAGDAGSIEPNSAVTSPSDDVFELKGEDQVLRLTREQAAAEAQKGRFVLPKIQSERDSLKKELEGLRNEYGAIEDMKKDLITALTGDGDAQDEAIMALGQELGFTEAQLEAILSDDPGDEQPDDEEDAPPPSRNGRPVQRQAPVTAPSAEEWLKNAPPEVRKMFQKFQQEELREIRSGAQKNLGDAFDIDKDFGNLKEWNPKAAEVLLSQGQKALQRRVLSEGIAPGPKLYAEVLQEVKQLAESFGISWLKPVERLDLASLGLGDFAGDPDLVKALHQDQPLDAVPVGSEGFDENFKKSFLRRVAKYAKGG